MSGTSDISHTMGGDLTFSDVGDLLPASDTLKGQQRVLRRLLTNSGAYVWNPAYGAGLPMKIGSPMSIPEITALVRSQMYMEQAVSRNPQPKISVAQIGQGKYTIGIQYTDANTGANVVLTFDPGNPSGQVSQ